MLRRNTMEIYKSSRGHWSKEAKGKEISINLQQGPRLHLTPTLLVPIRNTEF